MKKKDAIAWGEAILAAIKEADSIKIEISSDTVNVENLNTGFIERDFTGNQTIIIDLYTAKQDKQAALITRCQSREYKDTPFRL